MITVNDISVYWKHVAERNIAIGHSEESKHFSFFSSEEAITSIKEMKSPYLAAELPEIKIQDEHSDNVRLNISGAVLILKKVKQANYSEIQEAYSSMFIIAFQILTKLYNDRKKANDGTLSAPESMIKHLDLPTLSMIEVGPVFDGHYGWRINYQLNTPANLDLIESEWTGETKWKF